ncbi:MAG: universal stress protein [Galbitalea sp.]
MRNGESLETHQPDPTATAALDRAVALVRDRYPDLEFHARVVQRPASQALVDIAARADLFVIGRSRSDADSQPIGRVAHDVLLNLASPTVVVPPALSVAAAR